jgi:hypothetical protein
MTSHLTYHAARARIDGLLREAADRQRIHETAVRPQAALSQKFRLPRHGLGKLRRVRSGLEPRPATRI